MEETDLVTEAEDFIAKHPLHTAKLRHQSWRYLDNKADNRPVLVLLHGSRGNAYVFWRQYGGLGSDFRIISVALPLSDVAAEICQDLAQLLDQLGIEEINILGTSIGGYFAQWFSHFYPARVNKLIISSSIVDGRGFNNPSLFMARYILPFLPQSLILKGFKRLETSDPKYAELVRFLDKMVNLGLSAPEVAKRSSAFHVNGAVPKLVLPHEDITVLDCADEPYIESSAQQRVIEKYAKARHHHLEEGHHFPYIFDPESYNEIIVEAILPKTRTD